MSTFSDLVLLTGSQIYMRFEGEPTAGLFPGSLGALRLDGVGFDVSGVNLDAFATASPGNFFFQVVLNWEGGEFTVLEIEKLLKISIQADGLIRVDFWASIVPDWWNLVDIGAGMGPDILMQPNITQVFSIHIEHFSVPPDEAPTLFAPYMHAMCWLDCNLVAVGGISYGGLNAGKLPWREADNSWVNPVMISVFDDFFGEIDELVIAGGFDRSLHPDIPPIFFVQDIGVDPDYTPYVLPYCVVMSDPEVAAVLPISTIEDGALTPVYVDDVVGASILIPQDGAVTVMYDEDGCGISVGGD